VLAATLLVYPMDTVRRRLMMQSGYNKSEVIYTGTWHCFASIMRHEGCSAFFKGAPANVLRCVSTALVLVVYEELQKYLQYSHPQ
jgi:solute carrier family 25 (mitochondrial adenine nucleotide translocator), member 4/5/6/31